MAATTLTNFPSQQAKNNRKPRAVNPRQKSDRGRSVLSASSPIGRRMSPDDGLSLNRCRWIYPCFTYLPRSTSLLQVTLSVLDVSLELLLLPVPCIRFRYTRCYGANVCVANCRVNYFFFPSIRPSGLGLLEKALRHFPVRSL